MPKPSKKQVTLKKRQPQSELINEATIKRFEEDQAGYGTAVAMWNFAFMISSMVFKGVGATRVKAS